MIGIVLGEVLILAVDVGQPLRAWFTFWHPNTHSMLTEVSFCITAYLTVLGNSAQAVVVQGADDGHIVLSFAGTIRKASAR